MGKPRPSRITPEVLQREAEVIRLRREGLTWDMIAQKVGYSDASGAHRAYEAACKRIIYSEVVEIRNIEQDRLDIAQSAIWSDVLQGDLPAINTLIKIMDRRAKLLGLDMPIRVQQEVTVWNGDGQLDEEIQRLINQISDTSSGGAGVLATGTSEAGTTAAGG